ncbi:MAG TPA: methyltransferase domain-containing protein [Flavobacteriales bacterium]|nr:methyltransferase domain-containing protein [Flavobacteriales bacterium]
MQANQYNDAYWTERWKTGETQWDIGYPSTPLKEYIDQLTNKNMHILLPGAGNAWEGIYLIEQGFTNTIILDISPEPLERLKNQYNIPAKNLVHADYFEHNGQYDLILEQTFFCALDPSLRKKYVEKTHSLLKPGGKLAGVLFNAELNTDHPPFGGNQKEYEELFKPCFNMRIENCYNSIKPRQNRELFIQFAKK